MRPSVEARLEVDGQCAGSSLGVKPVADASRRPVWSTASREIAHRGRALGPSLSSTRRGLSPRTHGWAPGANVLLRASVAGVSTGPNAAGPLLEWPLNIRVGLQKLSQALRSRVSFCLVSGGPGVFLAAARSSRPGSALSKAKAGVVVSGTANSAAAMARREKDSSCSVGALVRIVARARPTKVRGVANGSLEYRRIRLLLD